MTSFTAKPIFISRCQFCFQINKFVLTSLKIVCTSCREYWRTIWFILRHIFRRFGTKCAYCRDGIIPESVIRRVNSHIYHVECFKYVFLVVEMFPVLPWPKFLNVEITEWTFVNKFLNAELTWWLNVPELNVEDDCSSWPKNIHWIGSVPSSKYSKFFPNIDWLSDVLCVSGKWKPVTSSI